MRVLDASSSIYRGLAWRLASTDLAVLRSHVTKDFADTAHTVLAWANVNAANAMPRLLDATDASIARAGLRITDYRRPTWSKDGSALYVGLRRTTSDYVGLRQREPAADQPKKSDDKVSDVEIWHTNDVHVIPEPRSAEQRDARASMLAVWHVGDKMVMQIGSDVAETSAVLDGDAYATETDRKLYAFGQKFGRRDQDLWVIDLTSGVRRKVLTKVRYYFGADPTGKRLSWFDGHD